MSQGFGGLPGNTVYLPHGPDAQQKLLISACRVQLADEAQNLPKQ